MALEDEIKDPKTMSDEEVFREVERKMRTGKLETTRTDPAQAIRSYGNMLLESEPVDNSGYRFRG